MKVLLTLPVLLSSVFCAEILYDGRAKPDFDAGTLNNNSGPYLAYADSPICGAPILNNLTHSVVKGSEAASHVRPPRSRLFAFTYSLLSQTQYTKFTHDTYLPTPLWNSPPRSTEDVIAISLDNSSVFIPGGNLSNAQYGFRRTELIAWKNSSIGDLTAVSQVNTSAFHFSVAVDDRRPLNDTHEYQIVFIEPSDGSHVFGVQLGKHAQ